MQLPQNSCQEREQLIFEAVQRGEANYSWSVLSSKIDGHIGEFYVFSDALKLDVNGEQIRVNVSARTQRLISQHLGCYFLTAKLADLLWQQRSITIKPFPRQITSSTSAMIEHSKKIDLALKDLEYVEGIVNSVGKYWIADNDTLSHVGKECNYGWHFVGQSCQGIKGEICASLIKDESGQYVRLIQGRGWAHDENHVDYSQICVLVAEQCVIDGIAMNYCDVASDPILCKLINHSGVLRTLR